MDPFTLKFHNTIMFFLKTGFIVILVHTFASANFAFLKCCTCIHVAKKIDKLGMRSSDTAQIFFEDVRVPSKNLIGEEGKGFTYQMLQFQEERLWGAATGKSSFVLLGLAKLQKTDSLSVLHNQAVHFRLAELATEVELLRSLLYRTVALYVEGNDVTKFASMTKLKAGRLAREVTDSCLQFWGGMGFTSEVLQILCETYERCSFFQLLVRSLKGYAGLFAN
uniref:Acyl-CoA dehydrogenase/oxidase C-terminal domain-containing protein n=1 Tax=Strix occidentalis caurina TaxID=311401 RepID=A0A8D0FP40_STROC